MNIPAKHLSKEEVIIPKCKRKAIEIVSTSPKKINLTEISLQDNNSSN